MTKLISAPAQPKTVISLSTLRTSKHTSSRKGDSAFVIDDSTIGSEYHYSASDTGSSTASQLGSSQRSPREVTSSIFSGNSSRTIAMAAMMTETATIDEKIIETGHAISKLTKTVEEKDLQIAMLINKLKVQNRGESSKGHSHMHQYTSHGAHTSSPKKANSSQVMRINKHSRIHCMFQLGLLPE